MVSYNWDHQDVIMRVVGSLQSRGYLVWVDTEQMKGATVDTMALAVEGSAVVLIGVSRAYKESSNCRMEAQYALQKKKPLVPLMLVEGYEADGWLGLLLGTSMWYGFYGDMLSSESSFASRVDSLARELGARGRADAAVAASPSKSAVLIKPDFKAAAETDDHAAMAELRDELSSLPGIKALRTRAKDAGVSDSVLEDLLENDDPRQALLEVLLRRLSPAGDEALRQELQGLRIKEIRHRAREAGIADDAIEEAADSDDPKAAAISLVVAHSRSRQERMR
jgi:hypothetical protein